ncbi:hypothetical protein RD792_015197 [Penstemon davidsonii]|uniref:C3H1-type domain-containing protein n=1 Tax=Penstemon davidsonii TaxID=160366 RepID=A0ABR0CSY4_9LAMI|nr:hypothetical protein RD792_015197 [Penstemon davidsonii]
MVGPGPQSQSQSQPQPRPSSPSTAEEEALKRNTDCVYFLASPLTCKKGSECDYRHSDVARVNPRDCWFWLNGNCLNTKCSFRHPPLDGLLGAQVPTPTGSSLPMPQTVSTPTAHAPNASSKQGVPCIFFQKGFCLKGDWCPFVHGPNSVSNKASLMPGTATAAEPATFKKAFGGLEKPAQDKNAPPIDVTKSIKVFPQAKPSIEVEHAPPRNEFSVNKRIPYTSPVNKYPGYRTAPSVANGYPFLLGEPGSMTGKDAEEVSREPSPGFDVLVDDERRDSDYYPSEDQYGMSREHEARNEYDIDESTDYNTIAIVDNERYQGPLGHDSHEHLKDQYAWEHRASSERMSRGSSYHERRPYARTDNHSQADELDLRHRLTKHKKTNGLRSVISHEHNRDRHAEDRRYHQGFLRDEQHTSRNESSISSRLRGRIKLPGRSSSPIDRETIRSSDRGRMSPVRATTLASNQGRIRDRIKGRVEEAPDNGGKYQRGLHLRRDMVMGDNSANFAAPKSLAELKNKKNVGHSGQCDTNQQSLGKRKHLMLDGREQSDEDLAFEGPKPLKEILKRKKGETISNNKESSEDNNHEEKITPVDKTEVEEEINLGADFNSNLPPVTSKVEAEEGIIAEDRVDQESDYEQVGGEDFELYEGDNGDAEGEEYLDEDDDDDDDFAKKMGVMYS